MTITYLIGNGFDINIGMSTRYKDFYKYYVKQPSSHKLIEVVKKDMDENLENWADLELMLGQYIEKFESVEEFDIVFDDIKDALAEYLRQEEARYDFPEKERQKLYEGLIYPEKYLPRADNIVLNNMRDGSPVRINVISFNYTMSLERFLGCETFARNIKCNFKQREFSIAEISHIHGFISDRMTLGVDDPSQINNEKLRGDQDIVTSLVKPEFNKALKHMIDVDCRVSIAETNWFCLFGLSMGDTDKCWWQTIGQHLVKYTSCQLLIFSRDSDFPANRENLKIRRENRIKNDFLKKTNLSKVQCDNIRDRIYIGYNTSLLSTNMSN